MYGAYLIKSLIAIRENCPETSAKRFFRQIAASLMLQELTVR
jgi:hypothetical protein